MTQYAIYIYRQSDVTFNEYGFGEGVIFSGAGAFTTGPTIERIRIVVEDDDDTLDYAGGDSGATSTLVSSDDPAINALAGQTITLTGLSGDKDSLAANSIVTDDDDNYVIMSVSIGGDDSWMVLQNQAVELQPNTTYSETYESNTRVAPHYPEVVPCYVTGTLIDTATGPCAIEDLQPGDLVRTRDHGMQPVRWVGNRRLGAAELRAMPNLRPIRIGAGALGMGLPERDLTVSPQHRLLISGKLTERMFGVPVALLAAKQLLVLDGVDIVADCQEVTYVHLLFENHEVVFAEGAPAESLYLGTQSLVALTAEARREIRCLFPGLSETELASVMSPASLLIPGRCGRRYAERLHKNGRCPLEAGSRLS